MKIKDWLRRQLGDAAAAPAVAIAPQVGPKPQPRAISYEAMALAKIKKGQDAKSKTFTVALHPKEATPAEAQMAMDDSVMPGLNWAAEASYGGYLSEGQSFLGYAILSELAQRPEFRRISEVVGRDMTRKWIKLQGKGKEDKTDKIKTIEDAMSRLNVQGAFQELSEQDGLFGRSHLYLDFGNDDAIELLTPIGDGRNEASANKVKRGSLKRITTVEAVWCYPMGYNTSNPLAHDWYSPQSWFVMGKQVHATRLLTFVGREVPDMLKPSYSFGGLSMTQMALPYVDNWIGTRQSVSDIIKAFSVMVLGTNLTDQLGVGGNAQQLFDRVDFFNNLRDNRGVLLIDKELESFENVSAPLGTLDKLQAQAQEHISSVSGIPLVVFTGITPSGLNATSDGEIDVYHTWIGSSQEKVLRPNLKKVLDFIQLSEFGEVDPDITFTFEPLGNLNAKEIAETQNIEAQTDAIYVGEGILDAVEVRRRLAGEEDSPYQGIDVEDVPPPPTGETDERDKPEIDRAEEPTSEAA